MQPNMKMLQEMQRQMQKIQHELGETIVEGQSGGGLVTVQVTACEGCQKPPANPYQFPNQARQC